MRRSEQQPIAGNQSPVSKGSREVKITLPYIKKTPPVEIFIFKSDSGRAGSGTLNPLGGVILQKRTEQNIKIMQEIVFQTEKKRGFFCCLTDRKTL